jgi:hypothetical protein
MDETLKDIRAEWFLSWSQISKMAGSRSNDIGPNRMTILPGFRARARPGLKYLNIFWAEKLVLVTVHQLLPRNVKKNKILRDWSDESVKNDHFTIRISGSGAARPEIFEHILD